ncbi:hypothetical protein GCM10022402_31590 [Salinactinospora qingdaonensis]|uniref:Uncharacterized protein n=2 Tax=Salinactinospora qingdaonensis TaxID=702744 RepID=A0ABP7FYC2_9ACTN
MPDPSPAVPGFPIDRWKPARTFPETYPGECPSGPYLLCEDTVRPIVGDGPGGHYEIDAPQGRIPLETALARLGLPGLAERFPVLAYGANRNPATLRMKLANYNYEPPNGVDSWIPMLSGRIAGADIAVCGPHGHGYFYGELLMDERFTADTVLDVHVCLADRDLLRVLNASEGVTTGMYALASVSGVELTGGASLRSTLGYIAQAPVWRSPRYRSPVSYAVSTASNRTLPALTSRAIMEHVLDTLGLRGKVSALSGLPDDAALASALASYLNEQWWREFNGTGPATPAYHEILEALRSGMAGDGLTPRTLDHLARLGRVLPTERADDPGPAHTWAALRT